MAQGSARFLLEFQVTGDQEVVGKIREVGRAGTEAASELQSLQSIEDPFAPIAEGAEGAIEPITGVGEAAGEAVTPLTEVATAAGEAVTPLTEMGSATDETVSILSGAGTSAEEFGTSMGAIGTGAEAAAGGLDPANTLIGDVGGAAETSATQTDTLGGAIGDLSGTFVAIGGTIGTAISAYFRYQDAQNRLFKSQTRLQSMNEILRKGHEALNAIIAATPTNTDAVAAANDRLAAAEARVVELMRQGITSGGEWTAAQAELQSAQESLAGAIRAGGGDWQKATDLMEKNEISLGKVAAQEKVVDKNARGVNQALLESVTTYASIAGNMVQVVTNLGKMKGGFEKFTDVLGTLEGKLTKSSAALGTLATALGLAYAAYITLSAGIGLYQAHTVEAAGDTEKAADIMEDTINRVVAAIIPWRTNMGTLAREAEKAVPGIEATGQSTNLLQKGFEALWPAADKTTGSIDATGESVEKTGQTLDTTGQAAAANAQAWANMAAMFQKAREQSELQSAALEKLIGPTTSLNAELTVMTGEINKLTAADVQSVAATEERNRAMIIANAGFNNATVAAIQYQQALTEETKRVVEDTDAKNANTRVNETMTGSYLDIQNAVATVNEQYSASVRELAAMEGAMSKTETRLKAVATAVNENKMALIEESIELDANIQSIDSAEQAQMRLANAKKEGILAGKEFISSLNEEIAAEKEQIGVLEDYAAGFGGLPDVMQPTVENLEAFIDANKRGGQAAVDFQQEVLDAYSELSSQAEGLLSGLVEAFAGPMKEQAAGISKAWEDVGADVKASLSGVQRDAISTWSRAQAEIQQGIESFSAALQSGFARGMDLSAATDQARGQIQGFLDNAAAIMGPGFEQVFAEAKDIAATGSADMIQEMVTALQSRAPADQILKTLQAINAKDEGTRIGTELASGIETSAVIDANTMVNNAGLNELPPKGAAIGAETGKGMGISLSQEFAAAGTHIHAVLEGIRSKLATGFIVKVDTSQAGQQLNSIVSAASSLTAIIKSSVDTTGAGQQLNDIVSKASSLTAIIKVSYQVVGTPPVVKPITTTITYNIITKGTPPVAKPLTTTITYNYKITGKPPNPKEIKRFISYAYRITNKIPNPKEIKRWISYAYRITNKIPNPPEIKRWITYRYRVVGSKPNPQNINRTITYRYRTVGSRPAQFGMHETLGEDTMIAAHKGERVDITPRGSTFKVPNIERTYTVGRQGGTGTRPLNVTVIGEINGKELIRFTRRGIMEEASGAM